MKKAILVLAIVSIGSFTYAQKVNDSELPAAVKSKFSSLYPSTKAEKWEKEEGNFKAEFDENKTETSVIIDPNGNLIETHKKIEVSALPKSANDYVSKNYEGKKITEAVKVTDVAGKVTYEAEVKETNLIFDSNGAFIKAEKEKEHEKEKEKTKN
jgi:hypothetical protein